MVPPSATSIGSTASARIWIRTHVGPLWTQSPGLCLEFSTRNAVFASALQVAYAKTYPLFDVTASDEEHNLFRLSWADSSLKNRP